MIELENYHHREQTYVKHKLLETYLERLLLKALRQTWMTILDGAERILLSSKLVIIRLKR